ERIPVSRILSIFVGSNSIFFCAGDKHIIGGVPGGGDNFDAHLVRFLGGRCILLPLGGIWMYFQAKNRQAELPWASPKCFSNFRSSHITSPIDDISSTKSTNNLFIHG